jgi:hypothetical protein
LNHTVLTFQYAKTLETVPWKGEGGGGGGGGGGGAVQDATTSCVRRVGQQGSANKIKIIYKLYITYMSLQNPRACGPITYN